MNRCIMGLLIGLILVTGTAAAQTGTAGKLTLSLGPSLNAEDGNVMATSITTAELLNTSGAVVKTATITDGTAQFDLSGVTAGDYFISVNNDANDLVPTRIDNPNTAINQFVGQKLRVTVIGKLSDPTYKFKTWSKGQGMHPVVRYSDGATLTPERYAYGILYLKTSPQKLEIRVLGTAHLMNSFTPSAANHPTVSTDAVNPPFSTWVFMTGENAYHCDIYNGTENNCNSCHVNLNTKPSSYSDVSMTNGWCYKCHYSEAGGPERGFIDTTSLAAATPTATTVAPTTTAAPEKTPKSPGFGLFFAIAAVFAAIVVRRR